MRIYILASLALATFIAASLLTADDATAKKEKKTHHACCAEKPEARGTDGKAVTMAKKEGSKACCDMEKAGMNDKKETGKTDCCAEHAKSNEAKAGETKSSETQKDTK